MHTLSTMPVYCSILATAPAIEAGFELLSLSETTATADKRCLDDGMIQEVWWSDSTDGVYLLLREHKLLPTRKFTERVFKRRLHRWTSGRHGVCAGLKIRLTWFESTGVHLKETR